MPKFRRRPYKRNDPANTMDSPPWWREFCDGYGGQQSLGGPSYEGAVGAYLFVCSSTGSTDIRLYASHKQFPIALHQFLVRVQAEYWKCRVIFVDTHSVNISAAVEEVLALFQVQLMPISTSTPQELSFAESRVRVIKRMSTVMLAGAPHLDKRFWAASDRQAVFVGDFMPQSSRNNNCSFYMRTGRQVDWDLIQLKVFGAPALYSDPTGPIHKRAPITEKGLYIGCQWPAILIKREKDGKIIMVSRQKVRVHELAYIQPLSAQTTNAEIDAMLEPKRSSDESVCQSEYSGSSTELKPEAETNMVQSVKSLQSHKQKLLGTSEGKMLDIEESAMYGNVDQMHEGIYTDSVIVSDSDKLALEIEEEISRGTSMKDALLKAIRKGSKVISKGGLARGKNKKDTGDVTSENILESKRKKHKVVRFDRIRPLKHRDDKMENLVKATDKYETAMAMQPEAIRAPAPLSKERMKTIRMRKQDTKSGETSPSKSGEKPSTVRKGKGKLVARVGDLISVSPTIFDGPDGAYSLKNPGRVFGTVNTISQKGYCECHLGRRWIG